MPAPPSFRKVNPATSRSTTSRSPRDTLPLSTVNEYAETYLAQRISTINGVAQVNVFGQQKYAVRVQLDPNALAARSVGINEVEAGGGECQRQHSDRTLYGKERTFACRPPDSCRTRPRSGR
jgi:HAE1 family hydrophobic/amphiphilic exporter-1